LEEWSKRLCGGILNAIQLKATNAIAESVNATIQKIKS
jgi:transposase